MTWARITPLRTTILGVCTVAAILALTPLNRAITAGIALATLNVALWIGKQLTPGDNT